MFLKLGVIGDQWSAFNCSYRVTVSLCIYTLPGRTILSALWGLSPRHCISSITSPISDIIIQNGADLEQRNISISPACENHVKTTSAPRNSQWSRLGLCSPTSNAIMGFVQLFWTTYIRKVHIQNNASSVHQTAEMWAFEVLIAPY